jgi:hypothetical protein
MENKEKEPTVQVRRSPVFKLKAQFGKNLQFINLKDFGFIPEKLVFERVDNNHFRINALLTPEQIKIEEGKVKAEEDAIKDVKKSMKIINAKKNDPIPDTTKA